MSAHSFGLFGFEIERQIGQGGFAEVHLARDVVTHEFRALKTPSRLLKNP